MKLRTLHRAVVLYSVNHFLCGVRFFGLKRKLLRSIGYEIGEDTRIVGPIFNTGSLRVGNNCWIGRNLTIHGNGTVLIGDNCDIAPEVMFLTGGHRIGDESRRAGQGETYTITVGNGVWIGARATVLRDTAIGDSAVIAACACVAGNVPDNSLAGGVPARMIKDLKNEIAENSEKQGREKCGMDHRRQGSQ